MHKLFADGHKQTLDELRRSGKFFVTRDDNSTNENTLEAIEKHFGSGT